MDELWTVKRIAPPKLTLGGVPVDTSDWSGIEATLIEVTRTKVRTKMEAALDDIYPPIVKKPCVCGLCSYCYKAYFE